MNSTMCSHPFTMIVVEGLGLDDPTLREDVVEMRIQVKGKKPPVWRKVVVHPATSMEELHRLISLLFEWDEGLDHYLQVGRVVIRPGLQRYDELRVSEFAPGQVLTYTVGCEPIRCNIKVLSHARVRSHMLPILVGGMRRMEMSSEKDVYLPLGLEVYQDLRRFRRYDELVPDRDGKMVEPWQAKTLSPGGGREVGDIDPFLARPRRIRKKADPLKPVQDKVPPGAAVDLRITLKDMPVPVWRQVRVGSDTSFLELHHIIQMAMGWGGAHLFEFSVGDSHIQPFDENLLMEFSLSGETIDASLIRVRDLLTGKGWSISYLYDFGDCWEHVVKATGVREDGPFQSRVELLEGAGACPPEDCGGAYGYAELVRAINDSKHPEHEGMVDFFGIEKLDPHDFDIDAARRRLTIPLLF